MAKSKFAKRYSKEFHQQMVELHRAGRSIPSLSREFGCSQWAISRWVKREFEKARVAVLNPWLELPRRPEVG